MEAAEDIRLTTFSHGSGCGCKIEPAVLRSILSGRRSTSAFPELLVGNSTNDDAAVWLLNDTQAMISTVDFFMPVVDDPYDFGRIAAANAISDVYAMGGRPVFANAILGWPVNKLPAEVAARVMDGAIAVCAEAGIPLAGGHSIDSPEPMFGLAVNGLVNPGAIKRNNTARAGDLLFLTRPLGTGVMGTAIRRGLASSEHVKEVTAAMATLNSIGAAMGAIPEVSSMTDVTGFGLLGHLIEMTEGSGTSAQLDMSRIPVFPFLNEYLQQHIVPDNTYRNWNSYEKKVNGVADMRSFQVLNDPQTSGGLLISVNAAGAEKVQQTLKDAGLAAFAEPIGKMTEKRTFEVELAPLS